MGAWGLTERQIEAILFVATQPVAADELAELLGVSPARVKSCLETMQESYARERGLTLLKLAGGWQLATAPDLAETVAAFRDIAQSQRIRLSKAALETLAVIAYSQPTTRSEVEEIRTVRCDRVIDTLLKYGLVRVAGRRKSVGTPLLYRTTERFLDLFGLQALDHLPSLEDLQDTVAEESPEAGEGEDVLA